MSFSVGDEVEIIKVDSWDRAFGISVGDKFKIVEVGKSTVTCKDYYFTFDQIKKIDSNKVTLPPGNTFVQQKSTFGTTVNEIVNRMGYDNHNPWGWGLAPYPEEAEEPKVKKCECGQSAVVKANEEDNPEFHSKFCPLFKEKAK